MGPLADDVIGKIVVCVAEGFVPVAGNVGVGVLTTLGGGDGVGLVVALGVVVLGIVVLGGLVVDAGDSITAFDTIGEFDGGTGTVAGALGVGVIDPLFFSGETLATFAFCPEPDTTMTATTTNATMEIPPPIIAGMSHAGFAFCLPAPFFVAGVLGDAAGLVSICGETVDSGFAGPSGSKVRACRRCATFVCEVFNCGIG